VLINHRKSHGHRTWCRGARPVAPWACLPGWRLGPLHRVLPRIWPYLGNPNNRRPAKMFCDAHNFGPWWDFNKCFFFLLIVRRCRCGLQDRANKSRNARARHWHILTVPIFTVSPLVLSIVLKFLVPARLQIPVQSWPCVPHLSDISIYYLTLVCWKVATSSKLLWTPTCRPVCLICRVWSTLLSHTIRVIFPIDPPRARGGGGARVHTAVDLCSMLGATTMCLGPSSFSKKLKNKKQKKVIMVYAVHVLHVNLVFFGRSVLCARKRLI
jgi:hypothetical protein